MQNFNIFKSWSFIAYFMRYDLVIDEINKLNMFKSLF